MKILLTAINAKFIHSNLAIRCLSTYSKSQGDYDLEIAEFTINHRFEYILRKIYSHEPDVVAFSTYIWNISLAEKLSVELKKILPNLIIILGGPEVSYNSKTIIQNLAPAVDFIISGEGEVAFEKLLSKLTRRQSDFFNLPSVTYLDQNKIPQSNPQTERLIPLEENPFPYTNGFSDFENRIVYYETSRGCPYSCAYCLSSTQKSVRFLPLDRCKTDLTAFLDAHLKQVKFVDRTFNCNSAHACNIWEFLIQNDNKITNFHFEIVADLMNDTQIQLLSKARKNLFQFEIGVQSTNPKTLLAIQRNNDFDKIKKTVSKIQALGNIHIHLDLIAGLPNENYREFAQSFDDVYTLQPDQLQLGFLKILNGTLMQKLAIEYSINSLSFPPFEVLSTSTLTFSEIIRLKLIEDLIETYYNSGRFVRTLNIIAETYESPFKMYEEFSRFMESSEYYEQPRSLNQKYDLICEFATSSGIKLQKIQQAISNDIHSKNEIIRKKPSCLK